MAHDVWAVGDAYEAYVGRWSRLIAAQFVARLDQRPGRRWLDVGCGTGALVQTVLDAAEPAEVVGVDPSEGFLDEARRRVADSRASFRAADAQALPFEDDRFDATVSGLVLNFVPAPEQAVAELVRVTAPGGVVAAYLWDYAEGIELMRYFWDAASDLNPAAAELDEGNRFPICNPAPLEQLWTDAGLADVAVEAIEVPTVFADFADYWTPFTGGQGPAPGYAMSLPDADRDALRELLRERLPAAEDGTIALHARAWAVRGTVPAHPG